jgi:hypothetical protein
VNIVLSSSWCTPSLLAATIVLDEPPVVAAHDRQRVALPDAERPQLVGQGVGALVDLREGQLALVVDERRGVRPTGRVHRVARRRRRPEGPQPLQHLGDDGGAHRADDARVDELPYEERGVPRLGRDTLDRSTQLHGRDPTPSTDRVTGAPRNGQQGTTDQATAGLGTDRPAADAAVGARDVSVTAPGCCGREGANAPSRGSV